MRRGFFLTALGKILTSVTAIIKALDAANVYRRNFLFHALMASSYSGSGRAIAYRNGILVTTGMRSDQNNNGWFEVRTKTGHPSTWTNGDWPNTGQVESNPHNSAVSTNGIYLAWLSNTELVAFVHANTSSAGVLNVYRYLWNGSAFAGQGARSQMIITGDGIAPLGGFTFRSSASGTARIIEVGMYNLGSLSALYGSICTYTDRSTNAGETMTTTANLSSGNNGTLVTGLGASFDWQHTGDGVTPTQANPYFYVLGRGAFNSLQTMTFIKCRAAYGAQWSIGPGDETGSEESSLIFNAWPGYSVTGTQFESAMRYHKGKAYGLCAVNHDSNGNYVVSAVKINPREGQTGVKMTLEQALPVRLSSDASGTYRNWALPNRYTNMGFKVYADRLYGLFFHKPSFSVAGVANVVAVDMETGIATTFSFTASSDNWRTVFLANVPGDTDETWFPVLGGDDYNSMNLAAGVIS